MSEEWQPIETAPKDGTEIIGLGFNPNPSINEKHYGPDVRKIKSWKIGNSYGWSARNDFYEYTVGFEPIAWMPLPKAPNA